MEKETIEKLRSMDLQQCESCEGFFDIEKTKSNEEQYFCENCWEAILDEVKKTGIKNLPEYLKSRDMENDFHIFSCAKYHGVTEEEFRELNPSMCE